LSARWDLADAQRHACDLASARVTDDGVALDFGARVTGELQPAELRAELHRTIVLDIAAAQALRKLLASVLGR
jgi:hypothetical protein